MHNHKRMVLGADKNSGLERFSAVSVCLLFASIFFCIPGVVYADSIATSNISFSNLQITASAGTIQFLGPWNTEAFAQAQNSLGELDSQSSSNTGTGSTATATVTFAGATGDAAVAPLSGDASSNASIVPDFNAQARSQGNGTLFNSFEITGGTGSVNVTFSAGIAGKLDVSTDDDGVLAQTETIFNLQLDGQPVLFFDSILSVGPNSSASMLIGQTLTNTESLNFNTPYQVLAQADSESQAIVTPEPPTASLLFMAVMSVTALVRKRFKGGIAVAAVEACADAGSDRRF
jgi:hypothetical protein